MERELFTSDSERIPTIIDGYRFCGPGCNRPGEGSGDIWCVTAKPCEKRGCACHLFSRDKDASPQDPDSWRHEADPRHKIPKGDDRIYRCFCVEDLDA